MTAMEMTTLLAKEKESLTAELRKTPEPEKAAAVLEKLWDKLQLKYIEEEEDDCRRAAAVHLVQTAKASSCLVDTGGEAEIWEKAEGIAGRSTTSKSGKITVAGAVLALAAILLFAAAVLVLFAKEPDVLLKNSALKTGGGLFGLGIAAMFLAGLIIRKKPAAAKKVQKAELRTDPEKCYSRLRAVALMIDRQIEDAAAEEKARIMKQTEDGAALSKEELSLAAELLEASWSNDGEYALERLDDYKHFLHKKGIETQEYDDNHKNWFELMPGEKRMTIRPAITAGGKLLKKGLATEEI